MAELADAHGSGPCESNFMHVQVMLSAPFSKCLQDFSRKHFFYLYFALSVQNRLKPA